jgi:hypothetical protein
MSHFHLDAMGGIAGDMFTAALLNAFPEHESAVIAAAQGVAGVPCRVVAHNDGVLAGVRFCVDPPPEPDHHPHAAWRDVRARLESAPLPEAVRGHAVGIFGHLAQVEARVHGLTPDEVAFHEVGAVDSLADIVAASWLIEAVGPGRWSVSPLPLGGGRVETAHGPMPVPAPATALLLEGFAMVDDGIAGERVTPTGAAILRYLGCGARPRAPGRLGRSGIGFGTRRLNGLSNVLRVLAFDDAADDPAVPHRQLAVIGFEVDDQSAEDLALGLDRVRTLPDVHDVLQMPAFGKKGRLVTHVQVLARPEAAEAVAQACFSETTTIGLRINLVQGRALAREGREVAVAERQLRVKVVDRLGGRTGKAEADDVRDVTGHAARTRLRRRAELLAESGDGA